MVKPEQSKPEGDEPPGLYLQPTKRLIKLPKPPDFLVLLLEDVDLDFVETRFLAGFGVGVGRLTFLEDRLLVRIYPFLLFENLT